MHKLENKARLKHSAEHFTMGYIDPDKLKQTLAKYGIDYDLVHQKQMRAHELLRCQGHL